MVVDHSDFSPISLTVLVTLHILTSQGRSPCFSCSTERILMALHVFVYVSLLVVCLLLPLARLGCLDWFHLRPSPSRGKAKRTTLHRLRHRPAAQTIARPAVSPPLPRRVEGKRLQMSRPWSEVKSRRGARHAGEHRRVCLSQPAMHVLRHHRCTHARVGWRWQAWPGRADPDVPLSGLPHHIQCSTPHALVPFENSLSTGRRRALRACRRAGPIRR
jgi:hypothetical protein